MADIRIKDLAVTASSSASDDYLAVDGSTNGTRKLSAYSPTFGGNLTVSGTVGTGKITVSSANLRLSNSYYLTGNLVAGTEIPLIGRNSSDNVAIDPDGYGTSIGGNLTVSGTGTSTVAGNLTVKSATAYTNFTVGESSNTYSVFFYGANQSNGIAFGTNGSNVPLINGFNNTFTAAQTLALQANGGNLLIGTTTDGGQKLQVNGTAAISGALSIGNTVQTAVSVASTHKVTISIGGSTYYLLATNV